MGIDEWCSRATKKTPLRALLREVVRMEGMEIVMEEGARGDPQSNGLVENAVQSIKG